MIIGPNLPKALPVASFDKGTRFKELLLKKQEMRDNLDIKKSFSASFDDAMKEMKNSANLVEKIQNKGEFSPDKLVQWQYSAGLSFFKVQMFCRVTEQGASTFKNFTQMQV